MLFFIIRRAPGVSPVYINPYTAIERLESNKIGHPILPTLSVQSDHIRSLRTQTLQGTRDAFVLR